MERVHFSGRVPLIYFRNYYVAYWTEKIIKPYTYIFFPWAFLIFLYNIFYFSLQSNIHTYKKYVSIWIQNFQHLINPNTTKLLAKSVKCYIIYTYKQNFNQILIITKPEERDA